MQSVNLKIPDNLVAWVMLLISALGAAFMVWFLAGLLAERARRAKAHRLGNKEGKLKRVKVDRGLVIPEVLRIEPSRIVNRRLVRPKSDWFRRLTMCALMLITLPWTTPQSFPQNATLLNHRSAQGMESPVSDASKQSASSGFWQILSKARVS